MNNFDNAAAHCRAKGWGPGTRLQGTEYYPNGNSSTCVIRITAVGERKILAYCETHDGTEGEGLWELCQRDWKVLAEDTDDNNLGGTG